MAKMQPDDPAFWMLNDGYQSIQRGPKNKHCYICNDGEYSRMGLPLCYSCWICGAHVPADDEVCDNGHYQPSDPLEEYAMRRKYGMEIPKDLLKSMETHYYDEARKWAESD